ncbi:DUF262 domain-containing protein [Cereibacter sphaeroides]|uniref:DUF262 domain-containing protein n=1 Tax=Cereibacter sphaeroides TaxID=1063 RepID=UPI0015F92276|nr:DUF262 domain-containing protein [Cereibacter sphaeroides]
MIIRQSDPDLESVARRILQNEIDLQPEFQRQEVWSRAKKQKLIDTILRGWAVPPIHLIQSDVLDEVLDGQQRLTAIRDFFSGAFPVDGHIPPVDNEIRELDGLHYEDLPAKFKRLVNRHTLRVYSITESSPQETSELFYRLNQPTALTSGEQRNALYGPRRAQMKEIVGLMISDGISAPEIGFSNARLSYDDVIARALVVLERGTLREKISESLISDTFRSEEPFSQCIFEGASSAVKVVVTAAKEGRVNLNKASFLSFVVYFARRGAAATPSIFELIAALSRGKRSTSFGNLRLEPFSSIFHDRASSRVTDVSSVTVRDFCIARCHWELDPNADFNIAESSILAEFRSGAEDASQFFRESHYEEEIVQRVMASGWGEKI